MVCANGGVSGTVSHVNSLLGACLVQGVLVADMAAREWPRAQVTEAHPKALLRVCRLADDEFCRGLNGQFATEHERDAAIAALTASECIVRSDDWGDLVLKDKDQWFPIGKPVAYWFPLKPS
jgi:hypothetical protein